MFLPYKDSAAAEEPIPAMVPQGDWLCVTCPVPLEVPEDVEPVCVRIGAVIPATAAFRP